MTPMPDPIGDVSFRHFGGEVDFVGMVAMLKAQAKHDGVDRTDSVDDLANEYRHATNCDLDADLAIAQRAGEIVGYSRVFWRIEEATSARVLGFVGWVHPEARGLEIEATLVSWSESRLRDIAAGLPYEGNQVIQSWAEKSETDKIRVFGEAGFQISQTYTMMTRSLDDPIPSFRLPAGLEFRPVDSGDARRVWDAGEEAMRDHEGFAAGTESQFEAFVGGSRFQPSLWKVVFEGDQIVGQVLNFLDQEENSTQGRKRGWTEDISVQRRWRNRGVAKAAIVESMRMFKQMGMTEVALDVHTTNPTGALQLYEGLGYSVVQTGYQFRKPFDQS